RLRTARGDRIATLTASSDKRLVVRSVGDVGGAILRELLAQHRDDLLSEQVELLQYGLVRQSRMVDEEELALVVTGPVAEAQCPLDHLLRRADGQRGLCLDVLEAGAVTVAGCVVVVGPVLAPGVLRALAHVRLAVAPEDRLAGIAVLIVLIALAVELDHPCGVRGRPEDVVAED